MGNKVNAGSEAGPLGAIDNPLPHFSDAMDVYLCFLNNFPKGGVREALRLLPRSRGEKITGYVRHEDAVRSALAGLLLRHALGVVRDEQLVYGAHGKPYMASGTPFFSISHGGDIVALSVAAYEHGLDVEALRAMPRHGEGDSVARQTLTPGEYDLFRSHPAPEEYFCRLWTAKECVMKATGLGLNLPPRAIGVALRGHDGGIASLAESGGKNGVEHVMPDTAGRAAWRITWAIRAGHILALALPEEAPPGCRLHTPAFGELTA